MDVHISPLVPLFIAYSTSNRFHIAIFLYTTDPKKKSSDVCLWLMQLIASITWLHPLFRTRIWQFEDLETSCHLEKGKKNVKLTFPDLALQNGEKSMLFMFKDLSVYILLDSYQSCYENLLFKKIGFQKNPFNVPSLYHWDQWLSIFYPLFVTYSFGHALFDSIWVSMLEEMIFVVYQYALIASYLQVLLDLILRMEISYTKESLLLSHLSSVRKF